MNSKQSPMDMLDKDTGEKLRRHRSEVEKLASSPDGQAVGRMIKDRGSIERALETGDAETLRGAIGSILATEEGSRLMQQLSELLR